MNQPSDIKVEQHAPEWIVNDLGELGVKVSGRFFFLYKGDNIEYETGMHDDGTPMMWRPVGKREFGETCWPLQWVLAGRRGQRYTQELSYQAGLSDGAPGDADWRPLLTSEPKLSCTCPGGDGALAWPCPSHPSMPATMAPAYRAMLASGPVVPVLSQGPVSAFEKTSILIDRSKRILALVDDYVEKQTADKRGDLRKALMDEFEAPPIFQFVAHATQAEASVMHELLRKDNEAASIAEQAALSLHDAHAYGLGIIVNGMRVPPALLYKPSMAPISHEHPPSDLIRGAYALHRWFQQRDIDAWTCGPIMSRFQNGKDLFPAPPAQSRAKPL